MTDSDSTEDDETVTVVAIDQWSATGDLDEWTFEQMKHTIENLDEGKAPAIEGGDASAARALHGGRYDVKEVSPDDSPSEAMVWFREGDDGGLEQFDSSTVSR